jgi:hypothetical protein
LADGESKNPPELEMLAETGKLKSVNLGLLRLFGPSRTPARLVERQLRRGANERQGAAMSVV